MGSRSILVLVVVAAVLGGLVLLTDNREADSGEVEGLRVGDRLIDDSIDINRSRKLVVRRGGETATLVFTNEQWVVQSLYNYPADGGKVVQQIRDLALVEIDDVRRGGSEFLEEFGLGTNATQVALFDDAGTEVTTFVLGRPKENGMGRFARAGEAVVVLNEALYSLPESGDGWIDKQLLQVQANDVQLVELVSTNGTCMLHIDGPNAYRIDGLSDAEQINVAQAGRAARAFNYLNFVNVADPARDPAEFGLDQASTIRLHVRDGITYEARVSPATDGKHYLTMAVHHVPESAPEQAEGESDEAFVARQAEFETRTSAAEAKAAELNRHHGWTYEISSYAAESMLLTRTDLIEAKPEPPPAQPEPPSPAPAAPRHAPIDVPIPDPQAD